MNGPYKAEDFDATELTKVIANACNCAYADGYKQGRIDKAQEIVSEYKLLTEKQVQEIRVDAIDECKQIVQEIKDNYNDSKFGEQIPINYGTICGIIIALEHLKEQK